MPLRLGSSPGLYRNRSTRSTLTRHELSVPGAAVAGVAPATRLVWVRADVTPDGADVLSVGFAEVHAVTVQRVAVFVDWDLTVLLERLPRRSCRGPVDHYPLGDEGGHVWSRE